VIVTAADGGCWVTVWVASSIVRLDRDGHLVEETRFQPGAEPHGLARSRWRISWIIVGRFR
jgi:hypothetical protein